MESGTRYRQVDIIADPLGEENPFENAFHAQATNLASEQQALAHLHLETSRTWKIVNPEVLNAMGNPVGYKFLLETMRYRWPHVMPGGDVVRDSSIITCG